jgi:hypothetical protein
MRGVVSDLNSARAAVAAIDRRLQAGDTRAKWQAAPLADLRAIAQHCADKRRQRQRPSDDETAAETTLFERSFRDFVPAAWPSAVPGVALIWNTHHGLICDALQAVIEGELKRLLITCEPRSTKSTLLSVMLAAWIWTRDPAFKSIHASMKSDLATRDSTICRRVIESAWFQQRWPAVRLASDQDQKARYETTAGGHRVSVGVGQGTGDGGALVALDDPHAIDSAPSAADKQSVIAWWTGTMQTRLNDPKTGALVVAGQRIAHDDLIGFLLETGEYQHLCFPHEFEPRRKASISLPSGKVIEDWRTQAGELLWPARCDEAATARLKPSMPADVYLSLYQQNPPLASGAAALPDFDPAIHVKPCAYNPALPLCLSWDFNVRPFCFGVIQHDKGSASVIHEWAIDDIRTTVACDVFKETAQREGWNLKGLCAYGDATGRQRKTSSDSSDWIIIERELREYLGPHSIRVPQANPGIKDTINAVAGRLRAADGQARLFIDPKCTRLIHDFQAATWPSDMAECHSLAWLRYLIHWLFPLLVELPPARWATGIGFVNPDAVVSRNKFI